MTITTKVEVLRTCL